MLRFRLAVTLALVAVALGVGLWLGALFWRAATPSDGPRFYDTPTVLRQVQSLAQLVTVKYVLEKVVVAEDVKWFGENRVLLVAHGVVKAGVDLQRMKPEDVRVSGRVVSVRLPPAEITDAYLDDKQTRVIERTTGLLRVFDKDLEQKARQHAAEEIRRAAREAGILQEATERARAQVERLLHDLGFERVEFVGS
jgi:hypothetical protein